MAYPTWPNPGPQSDIRLPLSGLVAVVLLITVLLGRAGRAFGAGFGSAFVFELLFMRGCTMEWENPGGTARAEAAAERRRPIEEARAAERAQAKWIGEVREHGLDLATGVHRLELATGCVLDHRKNQGELPAVTDSLPALGEGCSELQLRKHDESGWRILYSKVPGHPGDPAAEYRVQAGPDAALRLQGPLLEQDYRGIILRRDSANGPAFAVGSPLQPVIGVVMDCIRKNAPTAKAKSRNGVLTLRELVFGFRGCSRIDLKQVKTDGGSVLDDPNIARLYLPTTREFAGVRVEDMSTAWDLTYVPHGKTPADGYDLYLRPMMYGFTGVRSYLLTNDEIHVTWEERRATRSDPLAEACERDPNTPCGLQ